MKFMYVNLQVPGQPIEFTYNDSGITYKDEGPIQYITVSTQRLTSYEHVYVSVWAVNQVVYTIDYSTMYIVSYST